MLPLSMPNIAQRACVWNAYHEQLHSMLGLNLKLRHLANPHRLLIANYTHNNNDDNNNNNNQQQS